MTGVTSGHFTDGLGLDNTILYKDPTIPSKSKNLVRQWRGKTFKVHDDDDNFYLIYFYLSNIVGVLR